MIQIVHISDFHLDSKPISYKKGQLVNALVVDLEKQISEPEKCIFVISGDLMDKVGDNFECPQEGFTYFKEVFIDTIKNALGISYDQFFFVPGNHDVDRKKVDSIIENGILATVSTVEGINKFIVENKSYSRYLERLEDFKLFEENFYKDAELAKQMTNFDSCFITENNIGIACLNSSWRSSKANEDGSLIVGEKQVESAQSFLKGTDIRIAIMHHPLDDLLKEDKDKIKPILYKYFDVLLIGHKHHVDMEYTRNFHGTLLNCQSNASLADFSDASYNNGYSIINFTKNRNTRIQYRKYLSDYEVFVANTDVGTEDGCIIIPYPDENQIAKTTIVDKALNTLENVRFDNVDEHLFTYGLDPKIPCKINDLFVEPTLSNIPETHSTPDEIIYYHLTDIINGTDNYLIYGLKESGKSTLLNKLMVEFTLSYKHAEYIPINIAYNELATRSISQIIRDYLSISSEECRSLLAQNKLVLLIDDINFEGDEKLTKITEEILMEVKRIIDLDLPIDRITVTVKEAIDIYKKLGHDDKLNILEYRPDKTVHLYKCENYYDYMYCYMLPSTGFIQNYYIRPYSPGLIIQYPRYELNAEIPTFEEEPTYGKTLREAGKWGKISKTNSIVKINKKMLDLRGGL